MREGQYTTGRRSSPVPQLRCVGGSARGKFQPRAAQCFKEGFDGVDYQWRCVADMPADYEFGEIAVTCEGYDYPEDPYILKGSCGVKLLPELSKHFSPSRFNRWHPFSQAFPSKSINFIYSSGYGGGFDGGPGFGGGYPGMHPPPSAPPPSYDDTMGFKTSAPTGSAPGSSGPGFWTGAGLGALGGYLFGRNTYVSCSLAEMLNFLMKISSSF
ncbi:unnamed protein product [Haemonchus placei]|uniref:Store-operated calcium entry-associated regulatory factor n=1 Tax=Haemonchus placei TaxID=6290 RepID=A0A3P7ZJ52_HAEPC|nr:unnamed protein product [Haemonchus placei]